MSEHTQGRLTVGDIYDDQWAITGAPPVGWSSKKYAVATGIRNGADARRLVACWNACDGLHTESLERGEPLAEQIVEALNQGYSLTAQRDELARLYETMLAALQQVEPYMEAAETAGLVGDEGCHWPVEAVRAAIAAATTTQRVAVDQRPSEGTESARRIIGEAPRITEADRIAADLHLNDLKNSGELRRRDDERALAEQVKHEVPR